jgi:hypothetical protein
MELRRSAAGAQAFTAAGNLVFVETAAAEMLPAVAGPAAGRRRGILCAA